MRGVDGMPFRVGIVGVGGIAHCHGRAAREAPEAELAAICDVSEEVMGRFGETFGVSRRYTDLDRMLREEEIDILSVCTWGDSHADIAVRAALTGRVRAILCEKPISSTAAECEAMIEAAREHGVLLAEAFKFRHHPCHLRAKELIEAGEIGQVKFIRNTFTAAVDPVNLRPDYNWRFNRDKRGGATYDLGCYCIHHARFIAGSEPYLVPCPRPLRTAIAGARGRHRTARIPGRDQRAVRLFVPVPRIPGVRSVRYPGLYANGHGVEQRRPPGRAGNQEERWGRKNHPVYACLPIHRTAAAPVRLSRIRPAAPDSTGKQPGQHAGHRRRTRIH